VLRKFVNRGFHRLRGGKRGWFWFGACFLYISWLSVVLAEIIYFWNISARLRQIFVFLLIMLVCNEL